MNGELRIDVSGLDLEQLVTRVEEAAPVAVGRGMEHIHQVASPLVPVETGRLVGSAEINVDGDEATISYPGPYARYQHERLELHHEHGQAKYLEQPMATEQAKAVEIIGQTIKDAF